MKKTEQISNSSLNVVIKVGGQSDRLDLNSGGQVPIFIGQRPLLWALIA